MFLVLTTVERYERDKNAWSPTGPLEMRFNVNHIIRYAYDNKHTWLYISDHGSCNIYKVTETDKQIDAMANATDPTAARVLFAKKD